MSAQKIKYGRKLKLMGWPFIFRFPGAEITIGSNCTIGSNFWSNLLGLYQRTIIVARGTGKIHIGDRVGMSGATVYALQEVCIGDDTLIGANAKIVDNDFHPVDPQARLQDDRAAIGCKSVHIGKNVFIGMNAIILKGTEIGDGSVVGAGAVVTKDIPDNSLALGVPAKVVREIENDVE